MQRFRRVMRHGSGKAACALSNSRLPLIIVLFSLASFAISVQGLSPFSSPLNVRTRSTSERAFDTTILSTQGELFEPNRRFMQRTWPCFAFQTNKADLGAEDIAFSAEDDGENELMAMVTRISELSQMLQYRTAYKILQRLVHRLDSQRRVDISESTCRAVDDAFRIFTHAVFAPRPNASIHNVLLGVDAINLQLALSRSVSMKKYLGVPRSTYLKALQALTRWNEVDTGGSSFVLRGKEGGTPLSPSTLSFRILQRLITGVGVREQKSRTLIYEKDINMVLNSFSNSGRMDVCHRIVALQQRSNSTPPISPAGYSILLKGYGKLGDLAQVEKVLKHAIDDPNIQPDTIFMNSLINAFVECNAIDRAQLAFQQMKSNNISVSTERWFRGVPFPNKRTYNILLKGLGRSGALEEALELSKEMRALKMWDDISLNLLVQAALSCDDFQLAQDLLDQYTSSHRSSSYQGQRHPNTEAYTELLDRYAKAGYLSNALEIFQLMRKRGVVPNEVTFTCLISGLARHGRLKDAHQMLRFMSPTVISYNSFISAILYKPTETSGSSNVTGTALAAKNLPDSSVDDALDVFRSMIQKGIMPNSITVSIIVDALGKCSNPRVTEALLIVGKLQKQNVISPHDLRVNTALLRTCGLGGDIKNAILAFRNITQPDLIAVNAFIDICCRCNRENLALESFRHYFGEKVDARPPPARSKKHLKPDVISYTILIYHCLNSKRPQTRETARNLYTTMKNSNICPDTAIIDSILKALLSRARSLSLSQPEILFVANVVRDAERLDWGEGVLERRKRAVRAVLSDRMNELRSDGEFLGKGLKADQRDDDLFRRKGWNQIDSGFKLWRSGRKEDSSGSSARKKSSGPDEFLRSKGWNDVNSGFRII